MARALLLFVATGLLLIAITGYQATGATAGERLLGRLFGALIEVDRWLPAHEDDLRTAASDSTRSRVALSNFPIPMSVPADVAASNGDALRSSIVTTAGAALYADGRGAFEGPDASGGHLSLAEPARWTIDLLDQGSHGFWVFALVVAALFAVAIYVAAALSARRDGWQPVLLPVAAAAGVFLVATLLARLVFTLLANGAGSPVNEEVALIWRDVAWIGTRAGFAVLVVSLALLGLTRLLATTPEAQPWPGALDEPS